MVSYFIIGAISFPVHSSNLVHRIGDCSLLQIL
nr:MAG TPA: hypothetical protein [Caudoviricetes sp.]